MTKIKENNLFKISILLFSIIIYVISLFLVGYSDDRNGHNSGLILVLLGGFAAIDGGAALTWLSNPILWFSWIKINNPKLSLIGSILSTIISVSFMSFDNIKNGGTCFGTDFHISGSCPAQITSYGIGYFLWILSSIILLIGNFIRISKISSQPNNLP